MIDNIESSLRMEDLAVRTMIKFPGERGVHEILGESDYLPGFVESRICATMDEDGQVDWLDEFEYRLISHVRKFEIVEI